jgi:hypothetical protein
MAKIMNEKTTMPRHLVEDIEAQHGGNAFMHEQKKVGSMYSKDSGHKMHHEHVKTMCGGGMTKGK